MVFNSKILDIIACPVCKGKVHYDKSGKRLICNFDKLAFPIQDGVPIMVFAQAKQLEQRYSDR